MILASSLFSGGTGMFVKVLLLREVSDRPSTFFFNEIYKMRQQKALVPGSKDHKEKKDIYSDLTSYAESVRLRETILSFYHSILIFPFLFLYYSTPLQYSWAWV